MSFDAVLVVLESGQGSEHEKLTKNQEKKPIDTWPRQVDSNPPPPPIISRDLFGSN